MSSTLVAPRLPGRALPWGWTALLLAALAVTADWYAPPIFIGHSLVLGLVFYWVAMRLIGPDRALLVLVASTVALGLKWGQPYSGSIIALEGLCVGWAWRRRYNPLLVDLLFWAAIGTPICWVLYRNVYVIPHPSLGHALAVQPVNGLIAVWISYLVLEQLPAFGRTPTTVPVQSFRTVLLKRYVAFGTLPVLVVGLLAARTFEQRALSGARESLRTSALHVAALLSREVANGAAVVGELAARQTDREWFFAAARMAAELGAVHAGSKQFLTMLAADATGRVFAAAPQPMAGGGTNRAALALVADREYFRIPMATGRAHVSGVFRGRGFGHDLLVAVAAPAVARSGERLGIVEGSMAVGALAKLIESGPDGESWRVLLCDRGLQVIVARGFEYPVLSSVAGTPVRNLIEGKLLQPVRFTADVGNYRSSFLSVTVPVADLGWSLTVQREWEDVLRPVVTAYAWTLVVALATAVIASVFAAWSLRDFLRAWRNLITFSRAPTVQSSLLETTDQLDLPQEFHELLQNLSTMAQRLEAAQRKRDQLLAELESRVQERTQELEKALVLAQAADRAKSAFLATVSHELRTPLTSIITGVRLIKLSGSCKSDLAVRTLATLEKSSQVLMSVISDVLDYSKLEAGGVSIEATSFRPAEVIADVAAIMEPGAKRASLTLCVTVRHAPELEWVGDVQRLRQVLLNLAGNAIKFTAEGQVELSCRIDEAAARLYFAVADSGPGIPADRLESVFQPFVQLESNRVSSHAGTGLGLSICRRLVKMMGGNITVTSTVGSGSTFEFWLPAAPGRGPEDPAPPA